MSSSSKKLSDTSVTDAWLDAMKPAPFHKYVIYTQFSREEISAALYEYAKVRNKEYVWEEFQETTVKLSSQSSKVISRT